MDLVYDSGSVRVVSGKPLTIEIERAGHPTATTSLCAGESTIRLD